MFIWLNLPCKLSEMLCQMMEVLSDPSRAGWRQHTRARNRRPWCWKVCSSTALSTCKGAINCVHVQFNSHLGCVESRKWKTFSRSFFAALASLFPHFSFRKCRLNARNIIDRIIPTTASVVMVKNASFEMVEKRSLKMRLAMGTTLFCHLIVMQLGHVKSKSSVSG